MLTEAKIEANQANAQHSTGPRTEAGKAISSRNATRHGLTAATKLLPGEDPAEYQALYDGFMQDFHPFTTTQTSLTLELIDIEWRLRRATRYETKILDADAPDFKALNNLSLHAARLKRQFSVTLKELQELRNNDWYLRTCQLKEAELVHKADQILNRPSTFSDVGFDFTLDYLNRWTTRRDKVQEALAIVGNAENDDADEEDDEEEDEEEDLDQAA